MKKLLVSIGLFLAFATPAFAAEVRDADNDGISDEAEIAAGFDPYGQGRLIEADTDQDGLSNADELVYHTDMINFDTDGDGYADGEEVLNGYDPTVAGAAKLRKRIVVTLSTQTMTRYEGPKVVATHLVSTGRPGMRTPIGTFAINSKHPRAWSKAARLWMPYWMAFKGSSYGLHELPEWPGGKKEGQNHLGMAVSHGCVRMGVGDAKEVYEWAEVGTEVTVQK